MSQENVEIVQRFMDATNRGDREAVARKAKATSAGNCKRDRIDRVGALGCIFRSCDGNWWERRESPSGSRKRLGVSTGLRLERSTAFLFEVACPENSTQAAESPLMQENEICRDQ